MKKLVAAAAAATTVLLTSACGGGAERPTADELAETLSSKDVNGVAIEADAADCISDILVDSDISNDTLQDIADEEIDITGFTVTMPEDDLKAWEDIMDDTVTCITG